METKTKKRPKEAGGEKIRKRKEEKEKEKRNQRKQEGGERFLGGNGVWVVRRVGIPIPLDVYECFQ